MFPHHHPSPQTLEAPGQGAQLTPSFSTGSQAMLLDSGSYRPQEKMQRNHAKYCLKRRRSASVNKDDDYDDD